MKKSDMESLLKRLEKCEKKSKKAKDTASKCEKKHKKWKPKWIQMQKDIEELKALLGNKVDYNVFDEEMEKIRDLINSLASSGKEIKAPIIQSGPSISTKDMNDIKEMMKKVAEHEEKLKNLNLDAIMKKL
jgi:chromosome segregation ATPase